MRPRAGRALVALGSNLGDRRAHLDAGLRGLASLGSVTPSPLVLETPDEAGTGPAYLNTVALLVAQIPDVRRLLEGLLRLELACGRIRPSAPNAPRTLDLDLVAVEGAEGSWSWPAPADLRCVADPLTLLLPHPRAAKRAFVREPWRALGAAVAFPLPGGPA